MKKLGVAILGLGVVGSGTYKILTENKEYFKTVEGLDITVESVLEINKSRIEELGIEKEKVAKNIQEVVSNRNVDVVVEVMGGVTFAKEFVLSALNSGKTVVTSNKELVAKHWSEIEKTAKKKNVGFFYEASSVGGVPVIRTLIESMQGNHITSISGIINGTTNYILTKMTDNGESYESALLEAQKLGFAEANPTADVEGFDAMYKISILSSLAFNKKVSIENIYREGITNLKEKDIKYADELGYVIKLLGIGKDKETGVEVRVHPTLVKKDSALAGVKGSFNAVKIVGDSVGEITLTGRGAGSMPTASAVVSDVIFAGKHSEFYYQPFNVEKSKEVKYVSDFTSKYFIRIESELGNKDALKIEKIFDKGVVIEKIIKEENDGKLDVIVLTNVAGEKQTLKTLEKVKALKGLTVENIIRVED
ncbi:MAG: homoserine dehydrogenase [Clostridiales bacterium]|nr:homoserine dehydrogenase [Clostridiales bacterium]